MLLHIMLQSKQQILTQKSSSIQSIVYNSEEQSILEQKLQNLNSITVKLLQELILIESMSSGSSTGPKKTSLQAKMRLLSDVNGNLSQMQKISPLAVEQFAEESIIIYVRRILGQTGTPKIQALEYFRLILVSEDIGKKFIKYCLPVYIARVLERDQGNKKIVISSSYEDEAFQALRLINHWIDKFPYTFPQYLAFSLISFGELPVTSSVDERERKKDQISQFLKNYIINIFLNLANKNTTLCCRCGGFSFLVNEIINSQEKSYEILNRIILFINDKTNRDLTSQYIDLGKIFHIMTDLDNVFLEQNLKARNANEQLARFQTKVMLAKNAIIILMKSWAGLIFLGNNPQILHSLLEALKQVPKNTDSLIRATIFQCLEQILSIGDSIIVMSTSKNQFKISNLIGCYLMSVIELLTEQNILRILIQFSSMQDISIAQPAQRLLKRITLLIFNFRPESSKYIDFLITAASKSSNNASSQLFKSSSSFVINKISNYIYDRKQKSDHVLFNYLENLFSLRTIFVPYERASVNSIAKTLNFIAYKEKASYRKQLFDLQPVPKQHKEDYRFWKWDIIENLLAFPDPDKYKATNSDRYRQNKQYKYLLRFFSPSRGIFSKLEWEKDNFKYHKVGTLMIKNTITIPQTLPLIKNPPESQFQCTISFIGDLEKMLERTISECLEDYKNMKIFKTMQRELLGYIGLFSENKMGFQTLLYENNFFEFLYSCLHRQQCSHLVYLILMSLDFYRDDIEKSTKNSLLLSPSKSMSPQSMSSLSNLFSSRLSLQDSQIFIGPRALLERCIKEGSLSLKVASIQLLRILLMSQLPLFSLYCYKLLTYMLKEHPAESQIVKIIVQLLEDHLAHKKNISLFLKVLGEDPSNEEIKLQTPNFGKSKSYNNVSKPQQQQKMQEKETSQEKPFKKQATHEKSKKHRFSKIKHKLSAEIMIRLLSHETGFDLIQKQFPDWLESQYNSWFPSSSTISFEKKEKKKKQHYCLKVQSILGRSLNFSSSKTKQKRCYRVKNSSNMNNDSPNAILYDLLFLYKLPWIVWINDKEYPLWVRQSKHSYCLFRQFKPVSKYNLNAEDNEKINEQPTINTNDDGVKIMLAIGSMLVDEQFNLIDPENRNSTSDNMKNPLNVFLSINAKQVILYGEKLWMVESNGVQIYYYKGIGKHLNTLFIRRINIKIKVSYTQNLEEFPLHLICSLVKTKRGQKFIKEKQFIENCSEILSLGSVSELQDTTPILSTMKKPTLVQLRSVLWALGFYGSTNQGINVLSQFRIFDIIVDLSKSSHTLSLRGTCRYILNMFCHSDNGRALLLQKGFNVNSKCFSCYPIDPRSMYNIASTTVEKKHFLQSEQYWEFYNNMLKECPMTKNQQKIFDLISMLISSFSSKLATNQLKQILRLSPKVTNSVNLFQNVVTLHSYYKFKHENRKFVMNLFDQLLRSGLLNKSDTTSAETLNVEDGLVKKTSQNSQKKYNIVFYLGEKSKEEENDSKINFSKTKKDSYTSNKE